MKKTIFIINLSLDRKGSLNTFLQAMDAVQKLTNNYKCHVFCRLNELLKYNSENISIELINLNRIERILFESNFLIKWSKKNQIFADLVISLQNTSLNYFKDIPQIILFQQSIPLTDFKWNIFKKSERQMWFYKRIYPFLVKRYINNMTTIIAPTKWVRNALIERWNLKEDQVKVIYSQFRKIDLDLKVDSPFDNSKFHLFYPSNSSPHKNHITLIKALVELQKCNTEAFNSIILHLSICLTDSKEIRNLTNKHKLQGNISFEGQMDYTQVLRFYKYCNLLVWPSYIESFGLPLLEAASLGMPIISSNLPYAREVISGYVGVEYVDYNNPTEWAIAINKSFNLKLRHPNYLSVFDSDGADFIEIIKYKINSK